MLKFTKIIKYFANSPFLKPPAPLKPPAKKPQAPIVNQMSPQIVAKKLNISEQILRKQMINPKSQTVSKEQLQMISIINGFGLGGEISAQKIQKFQPKKKSPVVTIMGHVDHGKTTLIDFLRKSDIADKQHGGITQKIGAFHIECHGEKITFIDTPGHEAFTNMRQRGAKMTDLIVLIVAATEGVKQQTLQIIKLINEKSIPTIVAINKIDLPNADPQSCEKSLHEAGLDIEPMGGHIPVVHISAKSGQNITLLEQLILEQTKELKAVYEGNVQGTILEAHKNLEGLNAVTMVIQSGVLKPGAFLVVGNSYIKVKDMKDDRGNILQKGIPGDAVQIIGLSSVPKAGEAVYQVSDEKKAKFILNKKKEKQATQSQKQLNKPNSQISATKIKIKSYRERRAFCRGFSQRWLGKYKQTQQKLVQQIERLKQKSDGSQMMQEAIFNKELELENHKKFVEEYLLNTKEKVNTLNLILKFSNRGIEQTILEQLEGVLQKIKKTYEIEANILSNDVGETTSGDIKNAKLSNAEIITFGVGVAAEAENTIIEQGIQPRSHNLIHTFLKDIEEIAFKRKRNSIKGTQRGYAEVAEVYQLKKGKKNIMAVAGLKVLMGKLEKKNKFYVFRQGIPISQALYSDFIKVFKNQAYEVKKGEQCTISFNNGQEGLFEKGDQIHCYEQ